MRRSEGRILTTHTGSLPRPSALTRLYARRARGEPVDEAAIAAAGREALGRIVPKQLDAGLDVINNGEHQRESFALNLRRRLTGFGRESMRAGWADVDAYPEFKAEFLAQGAREAVSNASLLPAAIGPVAYADPSTIQAECAEFRAGVIDTLTNFVEHPEVVADRILPVAEVVGDPRRVLAGTDCGFDTAAGRGRVAGDVVWGKLRALAEGARLASARLFGQAALA